MDSKIHELPTPCLLIDLDRLERNLARMQAHAEALGVRLRPHVKTHKCVQIGRMQLQKGAHGITVATVHEARIFMDHGFDDVVWAFPLIPSRLGQAVELAGRGRLVIVIDSVHAAEVLSQVPESLEVWLKVDCGYHRAGVQPVGERAHAVARQLRAAGHRLTGVLSHSGDAYDQSTLEGRRRVALHEAEQAAGLAASLRDAGFEIGNVSVGSTPGTTAADRLPGVTEVRPGNYAFYDLMQVRIGSCGVQDCALSVLSTVVSRGHEHAVCDAGALSLSTDPGVGSPTFGEIYSDYGAGQLDPDLRIVALSQEHGKLSRGVPVGTLVRVLPNHSCLTAACFDHAWVVREDHVLERWPIRRAH